MWSALTLASLELSLVQGMLCSHHGLCLLLLVLLLLVVGIALLMHSVGLSMALGAFIAGVLLADSEGASHVWKSLAVIVELN